MFEMKGEVSGQWVWFIWYKALCWVTYGCNLALITYTITSTVIGLSLSRGVNDADMLAVRDSYNICKDDDKYVDFFKNHIA